MPVEFTEPVYTCGGSTTLRPDTDIPVVDVRRGGRVTWHGSGQLAVHAIIAGRPVDVTRLMIDLGVHVCDSLGLEVLYDQARPGLWVGGRKIGAIGMSFTKGVSRFGLSLNVDPDLAWFTQVSLCGQSNETYTSIVEEGVPATVGVVAEILERDISLISRQA